MVWVCPPHTSMNLNSSSPASSVIDLTRARAAAGSRNSSTNLMSSLSSDFGIVERVDLLLIVFAHLLHLIKGQGGLAFVDLGHREPDMNQHPVTDAQIVIGEQPDADDPADTVDVDLGQMGFGVDEIDYLAGDSQTHCSFPLSRSAAAGRRPACR